MSDIENIISQLEQQKASIDRAIAALRDVSPSGSGAGSTAPVRARKKSSTKRHITPEGRKRISEALRKRWAARREAQAEPARKQTSKAALKKGAKKSGGVKKRAPRKGSPGRPASPQVEA